MEHSPQRILRWWGRRDLAAAAAAAPHTHVELHGAQVFEHPWPARRLEPGVRASRGYPPQTRAARVSAVGGAHQQRRSKTLWGPDPRKPSRRCGPWARKSGSGVQLQGVARVRGQWGAVAARRRRRSETLGSGLGLRRVLAATRRLTARTQNARHRHIISNSGDVVEGSGLRVVDCGGWRRRRSETLGSGGGLQVTMATTRGLTALTQNARPQTHHPQQW